MQYIRWDPTSKRKVLDVSCVVPMTPAATEALRAGLELDVDLELSRADPGASSLRTWLPDAPADFSGNWITCWWFMQDDSLSCNGVPCFAAATLRLPDLDGLANATAYECANGCVVAPAVGFACPEEPGGGVGWDGDGDPSTGGGQGGGEPGGPFEVEHFLEGASVCDSILANPQPCNLRIARQDEVDAVLMMLDLLPSWAKAPLLAIVQGNRFSVWSNELVDRSGRTILADMHYKPWISPTDRLHIWNPSETGLQGGFINLRLTLCHEAVHRVYPLFTHGSGIFETAESNCMSGMDL